jgi:hypothetical protein
MREVEKAASLTPLTEGSLAAWAARVGRLWLRGDAGAIGLGVVALERAPDQVRVVQLNLQVMVLVGAVRRRRVEGEFVIRGGVGHALLQQGGDVVAGGQGLTTALDGQDLEAKIADLDLARLLNPLQEVLIVVGAHDPFAGTEGIDAVERDAVLAQLGGEVDDLGEELLLLLRSQLDARAGEQGPAGRDPKDDLAARLLVLAADQRRESLQGDLQALGGAIESSTAANVAQTDLVLIQGCTERVAVGGKVQLHLGGGIGDHGKAGGIGEVTVVRAQEFLDLGARIGDGLVRGVDGVEDQNHFGGFLTLAKSAEGGDGLRGLVIEEAEVLPLQVGNGGSPLRGNDYVENDLTGRSLGGCLRRCLLSWLLSK